jgi:hypothetical protein
VKDKLRSGPPDQTCSLCVGGSELKFEAPNIYCNNPLCGQRIKRNAVYFANENKRYQVGVEHRNYVPSTPLPEGLASPPLSCLSPLPFLGVSLSFPNP